MSKDSPSSARFNGGFGLETVMVLVLHALNKLRDVLETEAEFAMGQDQTLVAQIKSLQVAAGVLAYTRDTVSPSAIVDFGGTPPPELHPDVAGLFCTLSLCVAQALHVRRAALSGMSASTLAKLSAGAKDLAAQLLVAYDAVTQSGTNLTTDVKLAANDLMLLTRGWTYQYLGATSEGGVKVSSLRAAIEVLQMACKSRLVGKVAALDIERLQKDLDDAIGENRIVHQQAIPDTQDLQLPAGRALVTPAPYDAPRIPKADTTPR